MRLRKGFTKFFIFIWIALNLIYCSPAFASKNFPCFSLAWSEYPSWSVFGVAHKFGLIDGGKGKLGPIEKKYGVDIVLKEGTYDFCLEAYGSGQVDASCLTNVDTLNQSLSTKTVGIISTSTSYGADAALVEKTIVDVDALKGIPTRGLEKCVADYNFFANLEILGKNIKDYPFVNMDPAAAATAMIQKQAGFHSIEVWNPYVLQVLDKRSDVKVLFDSRTIPGEIIDMVVMRQSSLDKPGGKEFACAVIETFFTVAKMLQNGKTRDETLIAIGEKFCTLGLEDMRKVVKQTRFYETPEQALACFTGGEVFPGGKVETNGNIHAIMDRITERWVRWGKIPRKPAIGFGTKSEASNADFRFDPTFLQEVMKQK